MIWLLPILCILVGFITSWGLIPVIRRHSATLDRSVRGTEFHHSQQQSISRFGGLALAVAFAVVALSLALVLPTVFTTFNTRAAIVIGALAMFGLGFLDDMRPIGAKLKLIGQIIIASAVYSAGIQIEVFKNPFTGSEFALGTMSFIATVSWLVFLTNLINLIDGIDGLAGGITFMLMCLLANVGVGVGSDFSTLTAAGMAGALLGFLCYNFPPAKIYMGDGGAYFLGFLIGLLSITNSQKGTVAAALLAPMFALAVPIADVTMAIVRRGLKGLPLFRPDRKHIHHRLLAGGLSSRNAVLVLYAVSLLCLALSFGVFWLQGRLLPLLLGTLFFLLVMAARRFGIVKNWPGLGKTMALRQETRYALVLSKWLELEAERHHSLHQLWEDFQFVARKLRFTEVKLTLGGDTKLWCAVPAETDVRQLLRARLELHDGMVIEFAAAAGALPGNLFELFTELAAESWQKASTRWQKLNQLPLNFTSTVASGGTTFARRLGQIQVAFPREPAADSPGLLQP